MASDFARASACLNQRLCQRQRAESRGERGRRQRVALQTTRIDDSSRSYFLNSSPTQRKTVKNGVDPFFPSRISLPSLRPAGRATALVAANSLPQSCRTCTSKFRVLPFPKHTSRDNPTNRFAPSRTSQVSSSVSERFVCHFRCSRITADKESLRPPFRDHSAFVFWRYLPCVSLPVFSSLRPSPASPGTSSPQGPVIPHPRRQAVPSRVRMPRRLGH